MLSHLNINEKLPPLMTSVGASEADISSLQENKSIFLIFPVGWF